MSDSLLRLGDPEIIQDEVSDSHRARKSQPCQSIA